MKNIKINRIMETTYEDGTCWIEYEVKIENKPYFGYVITDKVTEETPINEVEDAINNDPKILSELVSKPLISTCSDYLELLVEECRQSENEMWFVDYEDMEDLEVTQEMLDSLAEEVAGKDLSLYVVVDDKEYAVTVYGGTITKFLF